MDDFPSIDLSVLTARQREVIEMHYSGRLSFGCIALFLESTPGAIGQLHRRAVRKLRVSVQFQPSIIVGDGHYKVDA